MIPGAPGPMPGMPPGGPRPGAPALPVSTTPGPPRELQVPAELVGGLIGPGGSSINELRSRAGSQVHISVLPAATPGGPQIARISGPEHLLQQAEDLVTKKLEDLKLARQPKQAPLGQMGPGFGGLRPVLAGVPQRGNMPGGMLHGVRPQMQPPVGGMARPLQPGPLGGSAGGPGPGHGAWRGGGGCPGTAASQPGQMSAAALQLQSILQGAAARNTAGSSSLPSRPAAPPPDDGRGGNDFGGSPLLVASAKCQMPARPPQMDTVPGPMGGEGDWGGKGGSPSWLGGKGGKPCGGRFGGCDGWGGKGGGGCSSFGGAGGGCWMGGKSGGEDFGRGGGTGGEDAWNQGSSESFPPVPGGCGGPWEAGGSATGPVGDSACGSWNHDSWENWGAGPPAGGCGAGGGEWGDQQGLRPMGNGPVLE
mmetsp:Transcript_65338/g.197239  ORF Transcript_65338/g.197239 Transcript_65338/m.197239 type:complete len:421 (+) Transcript_65338:1-1263(+)